MHLTFSMTLNFNKGLFNSFIESMLLNKFPLQFNDFHAIKISIRYIHGLMAPLMNSYIYKSK